MPALTLCRSDHALSQYVVTETRDGSTLVEISAQFILASVFVFFVLNCRVSLKFKVVIITLSPCPCVCLHHTHLTMYCLQWLLPVLFLPKPTSPLMLQNQFLVVVLYILGFLLERRPCTLCIAVFIIAVCVICYSDISHCVFCSDTPHDTLMPIDDI